MSDDAWNRFKPSKGSSNKPKQPTPIGWKSPQPSKATPKTSKKSTDSKPDLFSIWDDQRRMQVEEDKMARELKETKKKAKELQKTLRKHKIGETKIELGTKSKVVTKKAKGHFTKTKVWIKTHKKHFAGTAVLAVAVLLVFNVVTGNDKTDTLGDSTNISSSELPKEKPAFPLLYPVNKTEDDFEVVRNNPAGSAPSYVYLDSFAQSGEQFQVTQQEVPDNFDLEKTAKDFQASNIIQIDDSKVYHGFSEKAKIQSLMFIKDGKLVLIASPKQHSDDEWANYIISMK